MPAKPRKPRKPRQIALKPERLEKLLKQEQFIHEMASSDVGRELGQAHLAKYGVEPDPSLNQPDAHKAPPIPPKGKPEMAAAKPPVNPHTITPPVKQYGKLRRPAPIRSETDAEGKVKEHVIRGTDGEKHYAPNGTFTPEEKERFNYESSGDRSKRLAASREKNAARKAEKAANPDFTTSQSAERTNVHWQGKGRAPAKPSAPSVARQYAIDMTSQGVKGAIRSANPVNTPAKAKAPEPAPEKPEVRQEVKAEPVATPVHDIRASQANPVSKEPPTNPMPKISATRAEPVASQSSGKSFDTHADEALAVANSGRAPRPAPTSNGARANISKPQFEKPKVQVPQPPPAANNESRYVSLKTPKSEPESSKPASRYVESEPVDAVSGLHNSRAKRTAVKAARNLDRAYETHAGDARARQRLHVRNDEIREASRRQGPLDRLVNGPKEKPEVKRGPVGHAVVRASLNSGQKRQDKKLSRAEGKYEKAKSRAETVHDEIRSGKRRGSESNLGAIARTSFEGVKEGAKVLGEGTALIAKAEVTGVKRMAARAKSEVAKRSAQPPAQQRAGRAPESPRPPQNRNINPRQFNPSRQATTKPENFGGE